MTRGSPKNLCTYLYMLTHMHVQAYTVYFHTTELSNGQVFHKVIRLLSFDQSVAMLRANGHDNYLTVKIAASELKKKTVEMTN